MIELTRSQIRSLEVWRDILRGESAVRRLGRRLFLFFAALVVGGVVAVVVLKALDQPMAAAFAGGLITGVVLREVRNAIRFFRFVPIAREIISLQKVESLLANDAR